MAGQALCLGYHNSGETAVKVLVLSLQDSGGGCGKLARAISEHPDHQATAGRWRKGRVVSYKEGKTHCQWQPNATKTKRAIEWCDAIITSGPWRGLPKKLPWGTNCLIPPGSPRRPLVVNYRGTPYRQNRQSYNSYDRQRGVVQSTNFLDLRTKKNGGIRHWLPVPVWREELEQFRAPHGGDEFRVHQAITLLKRWGKKSTSQVIKALQNLDGVTFTPVSQLGHEECLKVMGTGDLTITAFKNGFGNTGLESLAMGIPIVANAFGELLDLYQEVIGFWPFIRAPLSELREEVLELSKRGELYENALTVGREYLETWHNPTTVAEKAVHLCGLAKVQKW